MSDYYQALDAPAFDYRLRTEPGLPRPVRGPVVDLSRPFVAFLGAAQTFGRFCERPFPDLVGDALGMPALNMAVGGAGPRFYRRPAYLDVLRRASLVVVQILSGRSASNSRWETLEGGIRGRDRVTGEIGRLEPLFDELLATRPREEVARLVQETRDDYASEFAALLDDIGPRTVLFWFASRTPDYREGYASKADLMGGFPQLVNRSVLDAIRPHAGGYAECISSRGLPQRLWRADAPVEGTRRHDDGFLYNHYYPSAEMHEDAAAALVPACRGLLG
ncbi:MAG: hypothetical protein IPM29_20605 [Planctomycetes bacterium]|nr:hypothetical protein [Planctomycetota bacterium]